MFLLLLASRVSSVSICNYYSLFAENMMQRLPHDRVSVHSWRRTLWHSAGIACIIALLIYGFPIGVAPVSEAQTSAPAASAPGFKPATPFRYRNRFPPYPQESLYSGEEGAVLLRIAIAADGRVSDVKVMRSSGSIRLDSASTSWIRRRWRFYPATLNGQPVASAVTLRVTFALKK